MSPDTVAAFFAKYGSMAKAVCQEVPEHIHPHMMRHTRAMHLYQSGMPMVLLSQYLGHAQVETTMIYAYADTEMKRKAIEKASTGICEIDIGVNDSNVLDDDVLKRLYGLR